ncbi:MAG: hypothetical protein ACOX5N_03520 [Bacilli bacterium]
MVECKLKLLLKEDSTIEVINDEEIVLSISSQDSTIIRSDDIFYALKYQVGKKYVLLPMQENRKPELKHAYEAFTKIYEFFSEVISSINEIEIVDELVNDIQLNDNVE